MPGRISTRPPTRLSTSSGTWRATWRVQPESPDRVHHQRHLLSPPSERSSTPYRRCRWTHPGGATATWRAAFSSPLCSPRCRSGTRRGSETGPADPELARLVSAWPRRSTWSWNDTTAGGLTRPDQAEHEEFSWEVTAIVDEQVRPGLAAYRARLRSDVLPAARDHEHPGGRRLPAGQTVRGAGPAPHVHGVHPRRVACHRPPDHRRCARRVPRSGLTALGSHRRRLHLPADGRRPGAARPDPRRDARARTAAGARPRPRRPSGSASSPTSPVWLKVPPTEEEGMAPAYDMVGAMDGSRPGTYFLNTSKPEERLRHAAEDTAFHEAVPGHHFQLTIALQAEELVPARNGRSCRSACLRGGMGPQTASAWPTKWGSTPTT